MRTIWAWHCMLLLALLGPLAAGQAIGLRELSAESRACAECHQLQTPGIFRQWGMGRHFRGNVGCFECHGADPSEPDAYLHYDASISNLVTPRDCSRCHGKEVTDFMASRHSRAADYRDSLDLILAEVVEGNHGLKTEGFPDGVSAALVNGCHQCHGSVVKMGKLGIPDPTTWPNSGVGRVNPDGSRGSCNACHAKHLFSVTQARHPDTCGKCHLGPDHPQKEIYEESKHGIAFFALQSEMRLHSAKWIAGDDYFVGPTCATCHVSATRNQDPTHDVGRRISWHNRRVLSERPEDPDAELDLPGQDLMWEERRLNMVDVCKNCHGDAWIGNFFVQFDGQVELYNEKFARPGQSLMALAEPLKPVDVPFVEKLDWTWFELWHHQGRSARMGAAMMGPDYSQWHGLYAVADSFYNHLLPQLEELAARASDAGGAERVAAAKRLLERIAAVRESEDHRWRLGTQPGGKR